MSGNGRFSRRIFFRGVVSVAALRIAGCDEPDSSRPLADVDVAVVGAGLSGLVAARTLVERGLRVAILEARDRVGGRTWSRTVHGQIVDGGGQWVGARQTEVIALARELGIALIPQSMEGEAVAIVGGQSIRFPTDFTPSDEALAIRMRLETMSRRVPLDAPWSAPDARILDDMSVGDFLVRERIHPDGVDAVVSTLATTLGASPSDVSLLWFLFFLHSAGGFEALDVEAQAFRLAGGAQSLSTAIAEPLADHILFDMPVRQIRVRTDARLHISAGSGAVVADRVVVAMMPKDAGRITFVPTLPDARDVLTRDWGTGSGMKAHVVYETPFWRDGGLSGFGFTEAGLIDLTFDATPPSQEVGILVVFVEPSVAPSNAAARRDALVAELVRLFGPLAQHPIDYVETNWAKEVWTAGCVSPLPKGVLTASGPWLRAPVGQIHWAGSETSDVWCGYLEGAVRAGRRAAGEVADALDARG